MINATAEKEIEESEEIQVLIFNILGTRIGIDMEQIDEMLNHDEDKLKKLEIYDFHEKILFRREINGYKSPRVLLLKDEKITSGVVIDQAETIAPIPISSIQPLPPLIESCWNSGPVWGVAIRDNDMILLVDFYKLLASKTIKLDNVTAK